jgi:tripartite-type tricarboxylate transporter receptor subunit TctC
MNKPTEISLGAASGVPDAIANRLAGEAAKAARSPAVQKQLEPDAAEAIGSTPKAYADYIAAEQKRWKQVIEKAHIKAD